MKHKKENKTKVCAFCNKRKTKDKFWALSASKDGLQSYCSSCSSHLRTKDAKKYYDKELNTQYNKDYRDAHPEKFDSDKHRAYMAQKQREFVARGGEKLKKERNETSKWYYYNVVKPKNELKKKLKKKKK